MALCAAKKLECLVDEVEDIYSELVMWKSLPLVMAFHTRLGERSWLKIISVDVLRIIMKFVVEF